MKPNAATFFVLALAIGVVLGLAAQCLSLWLAIGVALGAVMATRQAHADAVLRRSR